MFERFDNPTSADFKATKNELDNLKPGDDTVDQLYIISFYRQLRKKNNETKNRLYSSIMKFADTDTATIDDKPAFLDDVATTLASYLLQALVFAKKNIASTEINNHDLFISDALVPETTYVLGEISSAYLDGDFDTYIDRALDQMKNIASRIRICEYISGEREKEDDKKI